MPHILGYPLLFFSRIESVENFFNKKVLPMSREWILWRMVPVKQIQTHTYAL